MKKIITLSLLLGLIVILGGCSLYGNKPNNNTAPKADLSQTLPVEASAISINNFALDPTPLTVKVGTIVTWTNNDSAPHQIKSATFNSDKLNNGQSFSFTFNNAGIFDYSCSLHPSMKGQIIVK